MMLKGDSLCQEFNYDSPEFHVSPGGYLIDSLTQDLCKQQCAEQKFSYIGLMVGTYCLCGNDLSDFSEVDSSLCNMYCSGNSEEICGSNDTNLIYTMEAAYIGTVDNISLIIDDELFLQEIFAESTITVEHQKARFQVKCPKVVTAEVQSNCILLVFTGTSLSMDFSMNEDEEMSSDVEIPDPFFIGIGQPIPPHINETQATRISDKAIHLTYAKVQFKGQLLGFEYYVMEKGNFEFLVLSPTCDSASYCQDSLECDSSCNLWNVRKCGDDRSLCSYISQCIDMENLPTCYKNSTQSLNYETKYSFKVEAADIGYNYFSIPDEDNYDIVPGDIFGFQVEGSSSLCYRNSTIYEIENGIEDVSDGQGLGVLHYLQAIVVEPVNITLAYSYNNTGNYSISVTLKDLSSEYPDVLYLPVQIPLSNVTLEIHQVNIVVGMKVSANIRAKGSSLKFYWDYFDTEEQETFDGQISFDLNFLGSKLPTSVNYIVDFGDGFVNEATEITSENDEWKTTFSHNYENNGNFSVIMNISNPADYEIFELMLQSDHETQLEQTIVKFYPLSIEDRLELKGKNKTDAPKDALLYFENNITGHVTLYKMEFDDGSFSTNFTENIIDHSFPEIGEWSITFTAWNSEVDEYSNEVKLLVRILNSVSDVAFNASTTDTEIDEIVEFEIITSELDSYTCLMFDGGDDGRFIGFGNKDVCTLYYDEGQFKFVTKSSTSRILYSYGYGGVFPAAVDVFNSVSRLRKNITISVSDGDYKAPLVWIDKNSTDIERPIECQRGYDCRYETTAIFRNNESYLASHRWTAYSIDSSGKEEEIDITDLKTHNCSAIRIIKRSLAIGLYKLRYTLTVYAEDEKTKKEEANDDKEKFNDYYYRANQNSDDDEENLSILLENRTILGRRSVFSYLKIIPTPLIPMLINGGASYITRGFGQKVSLEPTIYTEDPDFPDEQNYEVTWFCVRSDKKRDFKKLKKYDYDHGNISGPITDRSSINEDDDDGGCFGKGPGLIEIGTSDYELNSNTFSTWSAVYRIFAVIKKEEKITEGQLYIKVLEDRPPSLRVREKNCLLSRSARSVHQSKCLIPLKVECIEDCGDGTCMDYDRMGLNQSLYALNPDVHVYLVEVTGIIPASDVPNGISSLFLIINHPPANGKCNINASSGMALLDQFSIEFSGWEDEEGHEIYDYSIYVKYGEETLRLSYGMKTNVLVVLPFGDLQIWCSIQDHLGAITMYSAANFTTDLPTEDELGEYDKLRLFDKALAEGKMALASQIVIAKNSILMEYRRLRNRRGDFVEGNRSEVQMHLRDRAVEAAKDDQSTEAVRWTQPLESYGADSNKLSEHSNVIQVEITPRKEILLFLLLTLLNLSKSAFLFPMLIMGEKMEYIVPSCLNAVMIS
ncbi:hypothetical protein CEXT_70301 [Caerostris extrusa]|uniref:WSC domain-containing protein n=1 Tax=Caerostris extrusa TaxID=172846 RepID=A0AAV4S9R9_CAEEX|nr:hypothetical protein CEXT_70301 [Caerostris extrusa]